MSVDTRVPVAFKNILNQFADFGDPRPFLRDPSPTHGGLSYAL